jgi:hypothetical protein
MGEFFKAVVLWPVIFAAFAGIIERMLRGCEHANLLSWGMFLVLMFGVWFPFLLVPYVKKRFS